VPTTTPKAPGASDAERRIYGELIEDVLFLRDRGHLVARFKGDYRIDGDVVSAAGLRERANAERKNAPPPALVKKVAAPTAPPADPKPAPKPRKNAAPLRLCAKCGGPRSAWSSALCRACYLVKPQPAPASMAAPALDTDPRRLAIRIGKIETRMAELDRLLGE
jgi:hypothetical protein